MILLAWRLAAVFALGLWSAALGSSLPAADEPPDWPQWRGPTRDGQIAGPAWPERLNKENFKPLWRKELGPSYSGPIVVGDRVFTTETRDAKYEVVYAFDRTTGRELWSKQWAGAMIVPFFAWANGSWIRATPACDGENLYVAGIRDVLACLSVADGTERWRVDFVKEFKTELPAFGFVSSPLVVGDHVYVQAGAAFVKLEKATGKVVWRVLKDGGGMYGSAFSSPAFFELGGRKQFVVQTREKLAGVEPESGEVLWSQAVEATRGMNILTPTLVGSERLLTSSHGGRTLLFELETAEGRQRLDEAWTNKLQGYMSSPVVIDGHAYLHLRNGRLACLDLSTGQEKWITTPMGNYWSMIAQGPRILALSDRGDLRLVRASPEKFDLVDTLHVADDSWAHLALRGRQVFVRELKALAVYAWE